MYKKISFNCIKGDNVQNNKILPELLSFEVHSICTDFVLPLSSGHFAGMISYIMYAAVLVLLP